MFNFYLTAKEANTKECRVAPPVEDEDLGPIFHKCSAGECALWRWKPFVVTEGYMQLVKKVAKQIGDDTASHVLAHKEVRENRAKHGLPEKPVDGYCGAAGTPRA